jgi:hypothetical protein
MDAVYDELNPIKTALATGNIPIFYVPEDGFAALGIALVAYYNSTLYGPSIAFGHNSKTTATPKSLFARFVIPPDYKADTDITLYFWLNFNTAGATNIDLAMKMKHYYEGLDVYPGAELTTHAYTEADMSPNDDLDGDTMKRKSIVLANADFAQEPIAGDTVQLVIQMEADVEQYIRLHNLYATYTRNI